MSTEAKVGAFVIAGLVFMGIAVFLLGDFTLEKRYVLHVTFHDVNGLSDKAPVKLSGVEVGKVRGLELVGDKASVLASISEKVPIYRDAVFSIGSTGIIGSKYLQVDQGLPQAGVLPPGSTVDGQDPVSIEKALTKALGSLQDLLGGFNGPPGKQGALAKNLNATIENVRSLTANLNDLIADTKPSVTQSLQRMNDITAKLDSVLAKTDQMMASINSAKGPVGALLHDEEMKKDVKETVHNLNEAAGTAKDVLGRMTQFRVYWNYDWRYEHAIRTSRADIGLKIYPREGRYYYVGGSNLGNISDAPRGHDYQRLNTVDALLGWERDWFDAAVGVIKSAGGVRLSVKPFWKDKLLSRLSIFGQGYDFARNRTVDGKLMNHPEYDFGAQVRLHPVVGVGARVEDVQATKRYQTWVNVLWEDKDIAYMLGMVSFGAAGSKGRSKK